MSEIPLVRSIQESFRARNTYQKSSKLGDLVDSKIREMVISNLVRYAPTTLLATAISPNSVFDLVPEISLPGDYKQSTSHYLKNGKKKHKYLTRSWSDKYTPLGLLPCEVFPPLTSIFQFILFLPSFRELFSFIPNSFASLIDFFDQYVYDQERDAEICSHDSNKLFRLLFCKMPSHFFYLEPTKFKIREFLFALIRTVFGRIPPISNSLAFHPEWHAVWDVSVPFSCAIDLPSRPRELFLTFKNGREPNMCHLVQRQFFTRPDSYCYDLDAFIEHRPDGEDGQGSYIAYLKVGGTWYQCEDMRIIALRSPQLNMALYRSTLLHYKRIWPS
jgi:hypothetical protein